MALSTEWVALKTGQSGSGGVEYSKRSLKFQNRWMFSIELKLDDFLFLFSYFSFTMHRV